MHESTAFFRPGEPDPSVRHLRALERLVTTVQDLSLARDLDTILEVVRHAARELTGADGASFVLRDGDLCYYAEEDAIAPLWKGKRFPMSTCISGWVMLNRQVAVIEDIYVDPRIPIDAYRPTFVRSLVMVPIRTKAPIGAIGNYWSVVRKVAVNEVELLRALADSTSVAMENVEIHAELERRVRERTLELEAANRALLSQHDALVELQRQRDVLSALVVHDLRSPAAGIMLSAAARLRESSLAASDRRCWKGILCSAEVIQRTALNLLDISRSQDGKLAPTLVDLDLGALLEEVRQSLLPLAEGRRQQIEVSSDLSDHTVRVDRELLRRLLQNLVDNALLHSPRHSVVRIEARALDAWVEVVVRDEGPGVPVHLREHIFEKYVRLGAESDVTSSGRGMGLTFCRLAVEAHGGTIRVEDNEPRGSQFRARLPMR